MVRLIVAEPVAVYAKRSPLVVDSSFLATWVFGEPGCDEVEARMDGWALCAPQVLDYEMANIGMNKIRSGLAMIESATAALSRYQSLDIALSAVAPVEMLRIAERYRLTSYDASYLWLADSLAAPLATFDKTLGNAARAHFAHASGN